MIITATTNPATDVVMCSAWVNGTFTNDELGIVTPGFQWKKGIGGTVYYYWYPPVPYNPGTHDTLYWIRNLDIEQTYYFRFGAYEPGGPIQWGSWVSFTTTAPTVTTKQATDIGSDRAYIRGSWIQDDEATSKRGWQWKKGIDGEVSSYWSPWGNFFAGSYDSARWLLDLDAGQVYYFRFGLEMYIGGKFYWGDWSSFITDPLSIAITKEATDIGNIKATLNGETIVGVDGCVESGFEWKQGLAGGVHYEQVLAYGGFSYSKVISNLTNDTLYYFRARGKNDSSEYFYGEWLSFTTTNIVPTVTTQIATDLEALSVTGNGTIVNCGGLEPSCSERGFTIKYEFSGNLKEYEMWKEYGFTGDIVFSLVNGLWEGDILKEYAESGTFSTGAYDLVLDGLINNKTYYYRAKAKNHAGWGVGIYLAFTTDPLLLRKTCTLGIWTILLCAYVEPIPLGSVIKRRGFRWGIYNTAQEYDIHEDGDFSASAIIGPIDTISFVCSNDDNVYDTIVDSGAGFLIAGFVAGKFIDVSATGALSIDNEGQFKIISVTADTITVNVRNTLVSEAVTGVTIVDLFALYIVDLDPETNYYSVAYVAIEDSEGNWTVQEGETAMATTIVNPFDFEGYDKVEFYKPEREQNYKKITRKIEAEIISEQQYIEKVGGRRFLDIKNHLIQTKANAVTIGTNYRDRFQEIKSLMGIEYPTPAPFQREDTLDIGFGRIKFKENDKGVVNFMPDGEGLMLFRYRMVMLIRKIDMGYTISKDNVDYMATMELEEA